MKNNSNLSEMDNELIEVFAKRMMKYLSHEEIIIVSSNLKEFTNLDNQDAIDESISDMTNNKISKDFKNGIIWNDEQYLNNHSDTLVYHLLNMVILKFNNRKFGIIQATDFLESQKNTFFLN